MFIISIIYIFYIEIIETANGGTCQWRAAGGVSKATRAHDKSITVPSEKCDEGSMET